MSFLSGFSSEIALLLASAFGIVVVWFTSAKNERRKNEKAKQDAYIETRKRMDEYANADHGDLTPADRLRRLGE